jgi:hypothetical protein
MVLRLQRTAGMPGPQAPDVNPASRESLTSYEATPVRRVEHNESSFTRMVEHQTAKIPSDAVLLASLCAMAISLGAELAGRQRISRFVGM